MLTQSIAVGHTAEYRRCGNIRLLAGCQCVPSVGMQSACQTEMWPLRALDSSQTRPRPEHRSDRKILRPSNPETPHSQHLRIGEAERPFATDLTGECARNCKQSPLVLPTEEFP